jgi:hypothetical protein
MSSLTSSIQVPVADDAIDLGSDMSDALYRQRDVPVESIERDFRGASRDSGGWLSPAREALSHDGVVLSSHDLCDIIVFAAEPPALTEPSNSVNLTPQELGNIIVVAVEPNETIKVVEEDTVGLEEALRVGSASFLELNISLSHPFGLCRAIL